jgi:hypothetical protein
MGAREKNLGSLESNVICNLYIIRELKQKKMKNLLKINYRHELKLTKSRLLKLFDHELVLKIWDTRDYCAARTKFDKPKPFKFSKNENAEENTRSSVLEQCDLYLKQIPKELHKRMERLMPNQIRLLSIYSLHFYFDYLVNYEI